MHDYSAGFSHSLEQKFSALNHAVQRILHPHLSKKYADKIVLNQQGDQRFVAGKYGADISVQRADDLDRIALHFTQSQIVEGYPVNVLDIGGGIGAQTLRFAAIGADVTLVDVTDQGQHKILCPNNISALSASIDNPIHGAARFLKEDVRDIVDDSYNELGQEFRIAFSQRMWSSMPYQNAAEVLENLVKRNLGKPIVFFLSAIGLDTEFGPAYPHRDEPVWNRWTHHGPTMAEKHGVEGHECLYRESDLRRQFENAGFKVIRSWCSNFGNPRVVAIRPSESSHVEQEITSLINRFAPQTV